MREHGRAKYVHERCRCDVCRQAVRDYERWRRKQKAMGREPYVDATKAREHVAWLSSCGMGWKHVARLAGVPESTVWKLLYGDPARNLAPSKRIRRRTGARIVAVMPRLEDMAPGTRVDATATHAQLRALRDAGWTWRALGERVGRSGSNLCKALHSTRVTARTALAVRDLYRSELQPPPGAVRQPGGAWKTKVEREVEAA